MTAFAALTPSKELTNLTWWWKNVLLIFIRTKPIAFMYIGKKGGSTLSGEW